MTRKSRQPRLAPDEALVIVHAGILLGRRWRLVGAEAREAAALRAEERLRHQLRRRAGAPALGLRRALARQRRRRRDAGAVQQEAGHGFVDAALDGAGIVDHGHAEPAERMQQAQAQRHLLERPGGDVAHQHGIGQRVGETGHGDAGAALAKDESAIGQRQHRRRGVALGEGLDQPPRVPVRRIDEDRDARHDQPSVAKDRARIAGSSRPRRKLRPLSSAVTWTTPGLNSIGSIW